MTPLLQLIESRKRRVAIDVAFDDLFMYSQFTEVALIEKAAERQAAAITSDLFYPDRVTEDDIEQEGKWGQCNFYAMRLFSANVCMQQKSYTDPNYYVRCWTLRDEAAQRLSPLR